MEARVIQTAPITMLYLPNRVGVKCPDVGSTLNAGLVRRRLSSAGTDTDIDTDTHKLERNL